MVAEALADAAALAMARWSGSAASGASRARHSARASGSSLAATRRASSASTVTGNATAAGVPSVSFAANDVGRRARSSHPFASSASFHRFALAADTTSAASPAARAAASPSSRGSTPHLDWSIASTRARPCERLLGRVRPRERESRARASAGRRCGSVKVSDASARRLARDGYRPGGQQSAGLPTRRIFKKRRISLTDRASRWSAPWLTIWERFLVREPIAFKYSSCSSR